MQGQIELKLQKKSQNNYTSPTYKLVSSIVAVKDQDQEVQIKIIPKYFQWNKNLQRKTQMKTFYYEFRRLKDHKTVRKGIQANNFQYFHYFCSLYHRFLSKSHSFCQTCKENFRKTFSKKGISGLDALLGAYEGFFLAYFNFYNSQFTRIKLLIKRTGQQVIDVHKSLNKNEDDCFLFFLVDVFFLFFLVDDLFSSICLKIPEKKQQLTYINRKNVRKILSQLEMRILSQKFKIHTIIILATDNPSRQTDMKT